MNKTYRLVWCSFRNAWIAVSELSKSKTKSSKTRTIGSVIAAGLMLTFSAGAFAYVAPNDICQPNPAPNQQNTTNSFYGQNIVCDWNTTYSTLVGNNITAAGNHEIKASNISVTGHTVTDAEAKAVSDKVGLTQNAGISTYANGESYYIARIKHFGDALTPWNPGDAYNDENLKYLGRYGMLRNNWYELNVGNVYGPGYPGVPPVDPTLPDDENEKYLSVSVKILSWAKRSDTVDL